MIRLKQLIIETRRLNRVDSLFNMLVYSDDYVPFSLPIIKKLVGNIKTTKVAHVTDYDGYKSLLKLDGTKKGISSFNRLGSKSSILRGAGIGTEGGVIVIFEGKILINSDWDLFSKTDSQGRKWIELKRLFDGKKLFSVSDSLPKQAKEIKTKYQDKGVSSVNNKEKAEFIKAYIDTGTKELLKRKKIFQDLYFSQSQYLDNDFSWNEIIVTEMTIKSVAFINGVFIGKQEWEEDKNFKLPRNGVIIDIDEVPKFLKKHGIKIK